MHIKKGDTVKVLTGRDRSKKGTVLKAMPKTGRVIVEGINVIKKHVRKSRSNAKGSVVEKPSPIHASNVQKV